MIAERQTIMRYHFLVGIVFMMFACGAVGSPPEKEIINNKEYQRFFTDFYSQLSSLSIDGLIRQLNKRIETDLATGGHITAPDNQDLVAQIKEKIHNSIAMEICPWRSDLMSNTLERDSILLRSVRNLSEKDLTNREYGMIVAVLVRILEKAGNNFCDRTNFDDLGK